MGCRTRCCVWVVTALGWIGCTDRPFADVLPDGAILSELYQFRADGGLDVGDDESASPLFDVPGFSFINVLSAASGRYLAFADDAGEFDPSMLVVARL